MHSNHGEGNVVIVYSTALTQAAAEPAEHMAAARAHGMAVQWSGPHAGRAGERVAEALILKLWSKAIDASSCGRYIQQQQVAVWGSSGADSW